MGSGMFTLTLDLTDHGHPDNPRAQHVIVLRMLELASQAIGSDIKRSGELFYSLDFERKKIGSWEFSDESTDEKSA
jgi:hypothetical protein